MGILSFGKGWKIVAYTQNNSHWRVRQWLLLLKVGKKLPFEFFYYTLQVLRLANQVGYGSYGFFHGGRHV